LSPFYQQLKKVKDHHRRLPPNLPAVDSLELASIVGKARISAVNLSSMFSGEESNGRFLDLNVVFEEASSLLGSEAVKEQKFDYLSFLRQFGDLPALVPEKTRAGAAYAALLNSLLAYLEDFVARSRPLSQGIQSSDELAVFDAACRDELDAPQLLQEDLFCAACQKLFTNAAVFDGHLSGKRHLKAQESLAPSTVLPEEAKQKALETRRLDIAKKQALKRKELQIQLYAQALHSVTQDTIGNIERRQALTPEERTALEEASNYDEDDEADTRDDESEANDGHAIASEDDLADGRIYNPLKLPLDWDGKPIPYWLWKLHGLGVQFPCEICGNFVYMGRRAFDQHFYEWRHTHGMKCLGIPNTRHFFQITKIEEAKRLWERMRQAAKEQLFRPDQQEECEDSAGNVYERRTFEDLKRQGLL
jgi:splicing factor 3A subunit 3